MKENVVSMGARIEVTKQIKGAYERAKKFERTMILDNFCQRRVFI